MSGTTYDLEFFSRRSRGFKDARLAVKNFRQVITGDCLVHLKHISHLFLMSDLTFNDLVKHLGQFETTLARVLRLGRGRQLVKGQKILSCTFSAHLLV